jgi:DNA modification methylase
MSVRILRGHTLDRLRELPDESVHCCVTSPPYWRQRDYGLPGQLGLEPTPEDYVANMVEVFAEVRRVLRSDGTCWVNLGDKWASGGNGGGGKWMVERGHAWDHAKGSKGWRKPPAGYKDKDLVGIPWMVAFAMRAEGWYLRQCNIWAKPNGMPESVSDRSTVAHEYVFHLTKNNDYWYDSESARMPLAPSSETRLAQNVDAQEGSERANGGGKTNGKMKAVSKRIVAAAATGIEDRRHAPYPDANLRSVWWIAPAQFREGHYAVMPDRLAELCIVAGCPPGGAVLDPFGGAGTTGLVADRLQRDAILIELNPEYADMAERRIRGDAPLFAQVNS